MESWLTSIVSLLRIEYRTLVTLAELFDDTVMQDRLTDHDASSKGSPEYSSNSYRATTIERHATAARRFGATVEA